MIQQIWSMLFKTFPLELSMANYLNRLLLRVQNKVIIISYKFLAFIASMYVSTHADN